MNTHADPQIAAYVIARDLHGAAMQLPFDKGSSLLKRELERLTMRLAQRIADVDDDATSSHRTRTFESALTLCRRTGVTLELLVHRGLVAASSCGRVNALLLALARLLSLLARSGDRRAMTVSQERPDADENATVVIAPEENFLELTLASEERARRDSQEPTRPPGETSRNEVGISA